MARKSERKRKKGGQRGNQNARRSGFYSKTFTEEEVLEIGRLAVADLSLDEEIGLLRVLMRRVAEADLQPWETVELLGRASGQLRRLVETKQRLEAEGQSEDRVQRAVDAALDDLAEELGVEL